MKLGFGSALTRLAFSFLIYSVVALATINDDIRKFVRVTYDLEISGVLISTSSKSKGNSSDVGLVLGKSLSVVQIKPSSLILVPKELRLTPQKYLRRITYSTHLVALPSKLHDLKLLCANQAVQDTFHEWGIIELCKEEAQNLFSEYIISSVLEKNARVAISRHDIQNAPIVELGVLRCMKQDGPCSTKKPSDAKLASVLASQAKT
ncbi:putative powdery mildew-specific protein [Erysiphe neolycopersici]|uniref:Putative powdery mildew-specific protein n=1 Tax=Erysiphe neolycopersici TaxID=212602 RepID=A0A420I3F4_9PEZI|nr:putative powdery mildew-specific protein [Erysiphe neolycopersici]